MQLLAMMTMLIDHIGSIFFPEEITWRLIGRIALPIYAYFIVQGLTYTRNAKRYLGRLIGLAALSQIPFSLSFQLIEINAIGTLAVSLAVLIAANRYNDWLIKSLIMIGGILLLEAIPFDYGAYALLLILIYRYLPNTWWVLAHLGLNLFWLILAPGAGAQLYSILPTIILAYQHTLFTDFKRFTVELPRWLWRSFYPAHLALLAIVAAFIREG